MKVAPESDSKRIEYGVLRNLEAFDCTRMRQVLKPRKKFVREVLQSMNPHSSFATETDQTDKEDLVFTVEAKRCRSFSNTDVLREQTHNPYHNANHIHDVLQRVTLFCKEYKNVTGTSLLPEVLPRDLCQVLQIAGLMHDIGHKGHGSKEWSETDKSRMIRRLRRSYSVRATSQYHVRLSVCTLLYLHLYLFNLPSLTEFL